jgi:hypothetical protein
MEKICKSCEKPFVGRTDKMFCSLDCKNKFNYQLRQNTRREVVVIDSYLHRNREILATLMGNSQKEAIDKSVLTRTGFKYEYMTGIYFNKEQKMYRIVYDYAWMDFSDQRILIVRKAK